MAIGNPAKVTISRARYDAIKRAVEGLRTIREIEYRFELLVANFYELELAILDATFRDMILSRQRAPWFRSERLTLSRKVINLLTTFRVYTDHIKHLTSKLFGARSKETKAVKEAMSKQFDAVLGYRTIEALRNLVQHRAMPIHTITYGSAWLDEGGLERQKLRYAISISLEVETLAAERKFSRRILRELRAAGATVDLKSLLREHMTSLGAVHKEVRDLMKPLQDQWVGVNAYALKSWRRKKSRGSTTGVAAMHETSPVTFDGIVYLAEETVDDIRHLQEKNSELVNLVKRYVSSEPLKRGFE